MLKEKKELKKRWEQTRMQADRVEYQRKKKEDKRAVAVARAEAASELNEELETVEGQKKIYRIAKYKNEATKDISHVKQMKDGSGAVLRDEERVKERWKEYFENLLNEESKRATSEWNIKPRTDNRSDKSGGGERIEEDEEQQGNGAGRDTSGGVGGTWRRRGRPAVRLDD